MTPIQQLLLGVGAKKKTYVDDVFSTDVYTGNATARSINNGIDLAGEGGLVWTKARDSTTAQNLVDTVRGNTKRIRAHSNGAETTITDSISAFNSNGYALAAESSGYGFNLNNVDYASWSFRKAPGFFDVVTYTGDGATSRNISHSLGSVPGMIMIKKTNGSANWAVYHRSTTASKYLSLNTTDGSNNGSEWFADGTEPTASVFSVGNQGVVNGDGDTYVAYIFAGGESTAATARSVDFDGSDDYLALGNSSDLSPEGGDFTWEAWIKPDAWTSGGWDIVYANHISNGLYVGKDNAENFVIRSWANSNHIATSNLPPIGQWTHVAATRSGSALKLFYNGILEKSATDSYTFATGNTRIGNDTAGSTFDGDISNLRFVKGTAVYTSSFRPPAEPLTNVTNTKLLCCNNSSVTGSTVAPATITSGGGPTASIDSPFDDPAAFTFGENGDQNVIKCGSITTDSSNGATLHLPWEPQWFLFKRTDASYNWTILDSMRGWTTDGTVEIIHPNLTNAGASGGGYEELKARTIKFQGYGNNYNFIWIAIRRPDGYCGKPADAGTDVFTMDTGSNNAPNSFDSAFPVDFAFYKSPDGSGDDWYTGARLIDGKLLALNSTAAEVSHANASFDSNVGWNSDNMASSQQSWMWKRSAGFDVVTYKGDGVAGRQIPHSLSKTPEMMWVKNRSNSRVWAVYHKDLGGSDPAYAFWLELDGTGAQQPSSYNSGDTGQFYRAPTATHFSVNGPHNKVNADGDDYIAMLFSSVDGISKVGYFSGSDSEQTISCGFQPRFAIIRNISMTEDWGVYDTVRGWSSGDDKYLKLNGNSAQSTYDFGQPTSTGFTLVGNNTAINKAGNNFIFYAHA